MYADPTHIRRKRVNLSLSETESRAVEALAELNGTQPSVFIRELVLEFMARGSHGMNPIVTSEKLRATH
jgi:hypothetical protein